MDLALCQCFISCFLTFQSHLTKPPPPPLHTHTLLKYFFCTLLFNNCRHGIPLLLHWTLVHSQSWTGKLTCSPLLHMTTSLTFSLLSFNCKTVFKQLDAVWVDAVWWANFFHPSWWTRNHEICTLLAHIFEFLVKSWYHHLPWYNTTADSSGND